MGLVDSSLNVVFMVVAKRLHFSLITPNDFVLEGLRLVFVLFGVFHLSKCLLILHLEAATVFRKSCSTEYWNYLWIFLCTLNNFPGSCSWNFSWVYRTVVWILQNPSFSTWIYFYILFPFYTIHVTFPADPLTILLVFLSQNPETSAQHWMKDARLCQEPWNSLTF